MKNVILALLCTIALGLPSLYPHVAEAGRTFVPAFADGDGDGFTLNTGDCDDADPGAYPGSVETCNGLDDDCDGAVDEGAGFFARDLDRDGRPSSSVQSYAVCVAPSGYFQVPGGIGHLDCDDSDPDTYNGADEFCDGEDNDCDGLDDEDFDADGDGYPRDPSCTPEVVQDCNDSNPDVYPGQGC